MTRLPAGGGSDSTSSSASPSSSSARSRSPDCFGSDCFASDCFVAGRGGIERSALAEPLRERFLFERPRPLLAASGRGGRIDSALADLVSEASSLAELSEADGFGVSELAGASAEFSAELDDEGVTRSDLGSDMGVGHLITNRVPPTRCFDHEIRRVRCRPMWRNRLGHACETSQVPGVFERTWAGGTTSGSAGRTAEVSGSRSRQRCAI